MPYFCHDDQDRHVTVNGNLYRSMIIEFFGPNWMICTWGTCSSNRMAQQAIQQISQSIYWKARRTCNLTKCSSQLAVSVVRFDAVRLFPVVLRTSYFVISNVKLQQHRSIYAWKSSKIEFSVWASVSVPVVAMKKKSSFIYNGIERAFTLISKTVFVLFKKTFVAL